MDVQGPYGNGFPMVKGKVALVGGGIGVAPLYYAAKTLKAQGCTVDLYLGFTEEVLKGTPANSTASLFIAEYLLRLKYRTVLAER